MRRRPWSMAATADRLTTSQTPLHGGRGAGKPDAGLGQRGGRGEARGGGGCADGCNDGLGDGALPEVVVAVCGCCCAALTGLIQVEARRGGLPTGIVHQPPEGLLVLVLPAHPPQPAEQPQQLVSWPHCPIHCQGCVGFQVLLAPSLPHGAQLQVRALPHCAVCQLQRLP